MVRSAAAGPPMVTVRGIDQDRLEYSFVAFPSAMVPVGSVPTKSPAIWSPAAPAMANASPRESIDRQAPNSRPAGVDGECVPGGRARPVAAQLDCDLGVVADGQGVRARSGLRVTVDRHGSDDRRQIGKRIDRVNARAGNVEDDLDRATGAIGVDHRLAQRARAAVSSC